MKTIYLVRHCKAGGQEAEAPLTPEGLIQAQQLCRLLENAQIERIVSSPYVRAKNSVAPLAQHLDLPVALDDRLVERFLCSGSRPDWQHHLQETFRDMDYCLEGGESSRAAMTRAIAVIEDVQHHPARVTLLATHGNLMTLMLKYFDDTVGFAEWQNLRNPDVYRVCLTDPPQLHRL